MSRTTCHVTQSVDAFSFLFAIVREGDMLRSVANIKLDFQKVEWGQVLD